MVGNKEVAERLLSGKVVSCEVKENIVTGEEFSEPCVVWGLDVLLDDGRRIYVPDVADRREIAVDLQKLIMGQTICPETFMDILLDYVNQRGDGH